jgi:1,4-dihydroxy-2-naphthoate octaprenyltransferase
MVMVMKDFKSIVGPMRVPFLILTPACVLLGFGTAVRTVGHISVLDAVLILIAAISTHISVNVFNEYFDFKSGLDARTERTPFSGGSGTLPEKPAMARLALITASVTLVITILIGIYFFLVKELVYLPLGILGLLVIVIYTPWLTRRPFLCLIAPGLGFGILMVMGTHYVLTGEYTWTSFIASLIPFFLVSDLLLLNQFPDVEADRSIGRKHLPIAFGIHSSSLIYIFFLLFTYLAILVGVYYKYLPLSSLLGLATVFIAIPVAVGAFRYAEDIKKLIPYMGLNVIITIITPVLVAIGLFVG